MNSNEKQRRSRLDLSGDLMFKITSFVEQNAIETKPAEMVVIKSAPTPVTVQKPTQEDDPLQVSFGRDDESSSVILSV